MSRRVSLAPHKPSTRPPPQLPILAGAAPKTLRALRIIVGNLDRRTARTATRHSAPPTR